MSPSIVSNLIFLYKGGINTFFLSDSVFHRHTANHSRKMGAYSIGITPVTTYVENVDFTIPSGTMSSFNQLLFFKNLMFLKKIVLANRYINSTNEYNKLSYKLIESNIVK